MHTYLTLSFGAEGSSSKTGPSSGFSDALMISLKMSWVSFWKMIASPDRTRFEGAHSVKNGLIAFALNEVLARRRPNLCS